MGSRNRGTGSIHRVSGSTNRGSRGVELRAQELEIGPWGVEYGARGVKIGHGGRNRGPGSEILEFVREATILRTFLFRNTNVIFIRRTSMWIGDYVKKVFLDGERFKPLTLKPTGPPL